MQIQCIDNSGFEDQLTLGQSYAVTGAQGYSVQLEDDGGQRRWYGRLKFSDPAYPACTTRLAA